MGRHSLPTKQWNQVKGYLDELYGIESKKNSDYVEKILEILKEKNRAK